jgi:hypothetical protein
MKRKTFRMSGGKDRKAQKEKFVFATSTEEETLPDMETKEDTRPVESSQSFSETSLQEENLQTETITMIQDNSGTSSEEELVEKKEEPPQIMEIADSRMPEKVLTETPSESKDVSETKPEKTECIPDPSLPNFYNGPNLAEIRKRCGITLKAIWEETKIPIKTLENIELENYKALPPEVYVRSFVSTYAKFLSLDPEKAVKEYMERYRVWKAEHEKQERRKSSGSIFGIKLKKSK